MVPSLLPTNFALLFEQYTPNTEAPPPGHHLLSVEMRFNAISSTYDHRVWRTGLPVRSAVLKPHAGQLVVWWVTTCES